MWFFSLSKGWFFASSVTVPRKGNRVDYIQELQWEWWGMGEGSGWKRAWVRGWLLTESVPVGFFKVSGTWRANYKLCNSKKGTYKNSEYMHILLISYGRLFAVAKSLTLNSSYSQGLQWSLISYFYLPILGMYHHLQFHVVLETDPRAPCKLG